VIRKIPKPVVEVLKKIQAEGFEAYIVGGCVRDLIMDRIPNDWDTTTNATPAKIVEIFPDSFYENDFGTVGVKVEKFIENGNLKSDREHDVIEVTTYRIESQYSDRRRPDEVKFAETLEEDLSRRDFTMNAIALKLSGENDFEIVDLFAGRSDIENKIIRTVGNADERFGEDALRIIRAIRFHAQLNFEIEEQTFLAIQKNVHLISHYQKLLFLIILQKALKCSIRQGF